MTPARGEQSEGRFEEWFDALPEGKQGAAGCGILVAALGVVAAIIVGAVAVLSGGDDEKAAAPPAVTVTETDTITAPSPKPKPPAKKPPAKPQRKVDPAASRQRTFLALDDDAIALDRAIGLAFDGSEDAITSLDRIRRRILNHNFEWAKVSGEAANPQISKLAGAATDAKAAAEAGDQRALVKARVAAQGARDAVAKFFLSRQ